MNDELDPQLQELLSEAEPYLDDVGFAASVLDRLPPPHARAAKALRWRIGAFGVAGTCACLASWASISSLLRDMAPAAAQSTFMMAPLAGALLIATGSLVAAFYPAAESVGKALALRNVR
jgi:hypothetical protein